MRLLGIIDLAKRWNYTRQGVHQKMQIAQDFPKPVATINNATLVFSEEQIINYEQQRKELRDNNYKQRFFARARGIPLMLLKAELAPLAGLAGITGFEYNSAQNYAKELNHYSTVASNNQGIEAEPTAAQYVLANRRGLFNPDNEHDRKAWQHVTRGMAIEGKLNLQAAEQSSNSQAKSLAGSLTNNKDGNSGICKVPHIYSPDDYLVKEPWMSQGHKVSAKQIPLLQGVKIYGLNPSEVIPYKNGGVRVHTEHFGGDIGARECFKNLTGKDVTKNEDEGFSKNGSKVTYRLKDNFAKIEINGFNYEKITFPLNF